MRGSVTPKRWILLAALVGLISVFAAGYPARWSGTAGAQTTDGTTDGGTTGGTTDGGTTVGDTPTPTSTAIVSSFYVLDGCISTRTMVLDTGQRVDSYVYLLNSRGAIINDAPGISFFVSVSGGTVSPESGTGQPIFTYTAPSSEGTYTVGLVVKQNGVTICDFTTTDTLRNTKILAVVRAPSVPPPPTPKPTNPVGIPVPKIVAQNPAAELSVVTPAEGGTVESKKVPGAKVTIRAGAVTEYAGVQIVEVDLKTVPPSAGAFKLGSIVLDIKITGVDGVAKDSAHLNVPAEICLPYTSADAAASFGGVGGLTIYRYDAVGRQWIALVAIVDPISRVICTNSSNFSLFALGLKPAPSGTATPTVTPVPPTPVPPTPTPTKAPTPQPTATAVPPVTGDFSANSGILAGVALFGLALILVGIVAMRRTRKTS